MSKERNSENFQIPQDQLLTLWKKILTWGNNSRRHFSFREDITPYRIYVAEVLLQKTPANRVDPVFRDIVNEYRNFNELANSDVKWLEKQIQPLGFKFRAQILHNGAQQVIKAFNGELPKDYSQIQKIPYVGPYTSKAIAVIAFQIKLLPVDGNVKRISERIFNDSSKEHFKTLEKSLESENEIRNLFWSILDFAAKICRAKKPLCEKCITSGYCHYFKEKRVTNTKENVKRRVKKTHKQKKRKKKRTTPKVS